MNYSSALFSLVHRSHSTVRLLPLIAIGVLLIAPCAFAPPEEQANCRLCHDEAFQDGMYLSNNQTTTNLGAGIRKVYQVMQGQAASIGIQVTNDFGGVYGLSLLNLTAPGYNTATNQLNYTGDPTWANRTRNSINYFTVGATGVSPKAWTHNLGISSNTPPDLYLVQMQMAGDDGSLWSQLEDFYIQVLAPAAQAPVITSPNYNAGQFSVTVTTEAGHTYYLEYKTALTDPSWTGASQVTGDGTSKVLTDSSATGPHRFYQVRVD
jgi:hypothetical protein